MEISTRRFFNSEFIIKNKLAFSTTIILQDIYFWLFGRNPPKSINISGKEFYFISQSHLAEYNYGLLSQPRINAIFNELKKVGIIESTMIVDYNCHYVNFNWENIVNSVSNKEVLQNMESNEWWKNIHDICEKKIAEEKEWKKTHSNKDDMLNQGYEIVVKNGRNYLVKKKGAEKESYNSSGEDKIRLLSEEDMGLKTKICKEADSIARLILKRYGNYFSHKVPDENTAPTKTYTEICRKITDIYNGTFIKSRFYPFGEKFLNNKQFNIDGWREKIREAKGDWLKVKRLILSALRNFTLMHNENRMPYSKDYLQTNLNLWLYDKVSNYDEPQSQFILCLSEPEFTNKHNSELKADRIFDTLSEKAKKGGNKLFGLNENMPSGLFWEKVSEIVEWGKLALEYEPNIHYWITSASELPGLFADYCDEKDISVSVNTLDIKRAVESNSPWTWFVKDMSVKHGLNSHLSELVSEKDFKKKYEKSDKITFDDMREIPVF